MARRRLENRADSTRSDGPETRATVARGRTHSLARRACISTALEGHRTSRTRPPGFPIAGAVLWVGASSRLLGHFAGRR